MATQIKFLILICCITFLGITCFLLTLYVPNKILMAQISLVTLTVITMLGIDGCEE